MDKQQAQANDREQRVEAYPFVEGVGGI